MTFATRTALALAAAFSAPLAQAQQPYFAPRSGGEMEQALTAERLAAEQARARGTAYRSNPAMSRLSDQMLVTRETQRVNDVRAPASTLSQAEITHYSGTATYPAQSYGGTAVAPPPTMLEPVYATARAAPSAPVIPAMPDARSGECFAMVRLPEQFQTYQQEYELRAASERIETIPPRYENLTEQYVVQEAYERVEVVPASFRMVTEQVQVAAPSKSYVSSEPVYETITERVLEQPARQVWKPGRGAIERIDNATGDILCLVEEPAIYKNITRRVLRQPAEAREVISPPLYTTVTKRVLDRPAEVRRIVVPQQLGIRNVRKLVEEGGVRRIPIPAQMGSTTVRELVSPSRLEWRSVLCETNMTPDVIRRVQAALAREGFNPGAMDGRLNSQTRAAINQYQRARNLPVDEHVNMDTVRSLGVM